MAEERSRKRPFGVTLSAVIALLGSLFMLACFAVVLFSMQFAPKASALPQTRAMFPITAAMFAALAAWGLSTTMGLFRMRNWACISTIVFGILLAFSGVLGAPIVALVPAPETAPEGFNAVRFIMAGIYVAIGALGIFWVYYFSRRSTREAFVGMTATESGGRPLSISIIGWWMLVSGILCALMSPLKYPASLLLWIATGWVAAAWYFAFGAIYAYLGYGLLRLNSTARKIAIVWICLGAINGLVFFFAPGHDARFQTAMARFQVGVSPVSFQYVQMIMLVSILVGVAVPLWFLITRQHAFENAR